MPGVIEGLLGLYNVTDAGARGDGQTNDTPRIHDAILALPPSGGTVVFPPGNYFLGSNVTFQGRSNVTLWLLAGASFSGPGALPANAGTNRVFDMSFVSGSFPPSGPAGGSLAGNYPNPGLAPGGAPTTQAFGDAASAGVTGNAADAGHRHGLPAPTPQLVNGGHEIAQRTLPVATNGAYATDRWQLTVVGTDTLSVNVDATAANRRPNSKQAAALTFVLGTGGGASSYRQVLRISDGYHHLLAQPFSERFWAKATVANAIRPYITTDGAGGATTLGPFHSGGGTFEPLDLPNVVVPADATFVEVGYRLAASGTFYVDNESASPGAVVADFLGLTPPEAQQRCFRYYQRWQPGGANAILASGLAFNATTADVVLPLWQRMAGTPTITFSALADWGVTNGAGANVALTGLSGTFAQGMGGFLTLAVAAGLTAGQAALFWSQTAAAWLALEFNP